jgi:hypothetical protein
MNDGYQELLTISECVKRLAHTSEIGMRHRIDKSEVPAR